MSEQAARGVLAVWTDVAEEAEAEFNAWYDRQHLAERTGISGFLNGRRYEAIEGGPRYLAWYETAGPDVLAGSAYAARQNDPTPWTAQVMPHFRNVTRLVAVERARFGAGLGGIVGTWRFRPGPGSEDALMRLVVERALPACLDVPGVVAARLVVPAGGDGGRGSVEARMRRGPDRPVGWAVLIEATRAEELALARERFGAGSLAVAGAVASSVEVGIYRLLYALGDYGAAGPAP